MPTRSAGWPANGQLFVVLLDGLAHGGRGANGIVGLPWVRLQGAEQSQDAVADELRNVAAVLRDGPAHAHEVAVQDLDEQRGLRPFAQRGEADDVGEQHGDRLLLRARRHAAGDDPFDDLLRREACERELELLEARRGALQATAQVLRLCPGAPEGVAESGDDRADPGGEKRARWHRDGGHRSSATAERRHTALASTAFALLTDHGSVPR
jgi:hypothetical protein